jgi:hypothetical protein
MTASFSPLRVIPTEWEGEYTFLIGTDEDSFAETVKSSSVREALSPVFRG